MVPAPFIVGTRNSGTTLLRLMLDEHPDLAIPSQTHFIPLVAQTCSSASDPRQTFLETLTSDIHWPSFQMDFHTLKQRLSHIDPFSVSDAVRVFYRLYAENHGKPRWGDKTPGYVTKMAVLQELLPEAHFIHIIRDGRAVAVSLNEAWKPSGRSKSMEEAASWWMGKIARARSQAKELSFYLEIRYEKLVLDTESTLRTICDFIELPWNSVMLDYHQTASERLSENVKLVPGKAASIEEKLARHAWTSKPPEPTRIDRWKSEMSESDRRRFEGIAGKMLAQLGYD